MLYNLREHFALHQHLQLNVAAADSSAQLWHNFNPAPKMYTTN